MACSPVANEDINFMSFSNPNYRLEDVINCNVTTDNTSSGIVSPNITSDAETTPTMSNEKTTNQKFVLPVDLLSPDSDLSVSTFQSPMSPGSPDANYVPRSLDKSHPSQNTTRNDVINECNTKTENRKKSANVGFLSYYSMLASKVNTEAFDQSRDEVLCPTLSSSDSKESDISTADSHDSGISSDVKLDDITPDSFEPITADITSRSLRKPKKSDPKVVDETEQLLGDSSDHITTPTNELVLPLGWQKHYDESGEYYWHIKSGVIQRDFPSVGDPRSTSSPAVIQRDFPSVGDPRSTSTPDPLVTRTRDLKITNTSPKLTRTEPGLSHELSHTESSVRYAVRSLGWVEIGEEDLTPERSSKAVNKCIVDLSLGRNDINDVVGRWGDGKDLYMDLDRTSLKLLDPQDGIVLNSQSINSVRVWGVGRDNGRDFAYVARDRTTQKYMCHVFRCDVPARQIANQLKDICKALMLERSSQQSRSAPKAVRPTNLPSLSKDQKLPQNTQTLFPTPMEEPRKVIHCHHISYERVVKPTGMDVVNIAIERAYTTVTPEKWVFVDVAIAPSTISIYEHGNAGNVIDECRVRYLSFMGIAMKNPKLCAFIIQVAGDQFYAHVFHCEPSSGPLCKTIEAACTLRFQKCMDAHPEMLDKKPQPTGVKVFGENLQKRFQRTVTGFTTLIRNIKSEWSHEAKS